MALVLIGVALFAAAGGLWWGAGQALQRQQALMATETSSCSDLDATLVAVAEGVGDATIGHQVEVCGTAKPGPVALTAPLSGRACVWYRTTVTEHYREYEWRGSEQNKDRRRELVDRSREVSNEASSDPFALEDGSGRITVHVEGADIDHPQQVIDRRVVNDDGWAGRLSVRLGPITLDGGGDGITGYQHEEWVVPVDAQVFAIGEAHKDGGGLLLRKPRTGGAPFIVSLRTEEELRKSAASSAQWMRIGMIAAGVGGIGCVIAGCLA
jgi:hypothetical protein